MNGRRLLSNAGAEKEEKSADWEGKKLAKKKQYSFDQNIEKQINLRIWENNSHTTSGNGTRPT